MSELSRAFVSLLIPPMFPGASGVVLVGNPIPNEPDANRVILVADDSAAQIDFVGARCAVPIQRAA
jgi:hypothetical protein